MQIQGASHNIMQQLNTHHVDRDHDNDALHPDHDGKNRAVTQNMQQQATQKLQRAAQPHLGQHVNVTA